MLYFNLPCNFFFALDENMLSALKGLLYCNSSSPGGISTCLLYKYRFSVTFPTYFLGAALMKVTLHLYGKHVLRLLFLKTSNPTAITNYRSIFILPHLTNIL